MKKRILGFYLAPGFSMMSLLSMTEPLRAANEIAGREIYTVRFFAEEQKTTAINGMSISTDSGFPRARDFEAVVVCASYNPEVSASKKTHNWLRWLDAHGVALGSADTGAYILASAGLLTKGSVTLHWANLTAFKEMFPDIKTSSRLMEFSERRFSCAGATTGLDMILHLLADHHGEGFRAKVADHFIHTPEGNRADLEQSVLSDLFKGIRVPIVRSALRMMENSSAEKIQISELALSLGVTVKQLERAFRRTLDDTPSRIYQKVRLQKAHSLVTQTSLNIAEIALACGFASRSQFSRAYKTVFNSSPGANRLAGSLMSSLDIKLPD